VGTEGTGTDGVTWTKDTGEITAKIERKDAATRSRETSRPRH
jgi:hypothetical protein